MGVRATSHTRSPGSEANAAAGVLGDYQATKQISIFKLPFNPITSVFKEVYYY